MKDFVEFSVNGVRAQVAGPDAFLPLADYLRYRAGLTGTKIVCAEGDCGACTVLARCLHRPHGRFEIINACIYFVWQLDGHQVITVEGLKRNGQLHPAQETMIQCHGAQCGYCTPGFVCSLAKLADDALAESWQIDRKRAQDYLIGNLCRCTGYDSILEAAISMHYDELPPLNEFYALESHRIPAQQCKTLSFKNKTVLMPTTLAEAQGFCHLNPQIVAGSTDLGVLHKGRWIPQTLMSLKNIGELDRVEFRTERVKIGANVTLAEIEKQLCAEFSELRRLLRIFASPQIKNTATLVGNLMNASPIADTIPFLKVVDAKIHLLGTAGVRTLDINDFFQDGYKQLDRRPDEFVTHIELPLRGYRFKLYKASRRKDLDISAVTAAFGYQLHDGQFAHFAMAFGGIGASVIRFKDLESDIIGQAPERRLFETLSVEIDRQIKPLTDVRGSADYRRLLVRNFLLKFYDELVASEVGV
jgi:xanthine dehydrogenase small subunit